MNKYNITNIILLILLLGFGITSCDDRDEEIKELDLERLFTPSGLESTLSKEINLMLKWKSIKGAESYIVELYKDSLVFAEANLVESIEVEDNQLTYVLEGDTRYSIRIKSMSETENKESKWSTGLTFRSGLNNILLPQQSGDITTNEATFRWPAGVKATHLVLSPAAGDAINHTITDAEVELGIVTISGLNPATEYTASLYNNSSKIGYMTIVTVSDGAIIVNPGDDLLAKIAEAEDGDILIIKEGDYLADGETIVISKSITIKGEAESSRPTIHAQFNIEKVASLNLTNLILTGKKGDATQYDYFLKFIATEGTYGTITVSGCEIKNYNKSLIAGESAMKGVIESIKVDNCVVTNIEGSGGDGIDIRAGLLKNLSLTNSTFNNITPTRDFIRLDDSSASFPSQKSTIVVDRCTFYKVSLSNRIMYVRFVSNEISVSNSIFANTDGYYSNQSKTADIKCSGNNYYLAPNFYVETGEGVKGYKYDTSGAYTKNNPKFADPEKGDFTIGDLGAVSVGDPRWIK